MHLAPQASRDALQMVQDVLIFQLHALIIREHKHNAMLLKDSMELRHVEIQQEQ